MLNFLAGPQGTDQQVAGNEAAFDAGARIGAQGVADAEQRAADTAAQQEKERSAAELQTAKAKGELLQKRVEQIGKVNEEGYKNLRATLAGNVNDLRTRLEAQNLDSHSQDIVRQNLEKNQGLLAELDRSYGQIAATTQPGQPTQFDPKFYSAPGVPNDLGLNEQAKQELAGKRAKTYYEGLEAEQKFNTAAGKGAAPEKIAPKAEDARDAFSGAATMLPTKAQRLVEATRYRDEHPDDSEANRFYNEAYDDFHKTRDAIGSNYSAMVDRLSDGGFGETMRDTWSSVLGALPRGTDPNLVDNHTMVAQAIAGELKPLAEKKLKSGLTPAELTRAARLSKLAEILKADRDIAGSLQAGRTGPGGTPPSPALYPNLPASQNNIKDVPMATGTEVAR